MAIQEGDNSGTRISTADELFAGMLGLTFFADRFNVYVNSNYGETGANDGHIWGVDASNTINGGISLLENTGGILNLTGGSFNGSSLATYNYLRGTSAVISGGTFSRLYVYGLNADFSGDTSIVVNGGSIANLYASGYGGTASGNVTITINGGSVTNLRGIAGDTTEKTYFDGRAEFVINTTLNIASMDGGATRLVARDGNAVDLTVTGSGNLTVSGDFKDTTGVIIANGGSMTFTGTGKTFSLRGGIVNDGTLSLGGGASYTASVAGDVVNRGVLVLDANGSLKVSGNFINSGLIRIDGTFSPGATTIATFSANSAVTLGNYEFTSISGNYIYGLEVNAQKLKVKVTAPIVHIDFTWTQESCPSQYEWGISATNTYTGLDDMLLNDRNISVVFQEGELAPDYTIKTDVLTKFSTLASQLSGVNLEITGDAELYGERHNISTNNSVLTSSYFNYFAYGNNLLISGGAVGYQTYNETQTSGTVNIFGGGNKISLSSTNVTMTAGNFTDARLFGGIYSGQGTSVGSANVTVSGGSIGKVYGGGATWKDETTYGDSNYTVDANVLITGSAVVDQVFAGGRGHSQVTGTATVTVTGLEAAGRVSEIYGGGCGRSRVNRSEINITDATVGSVYSGGLTGVGADGTFTLGSEVTRATVNLSGATVAGVLSGTGNHVLCTVKRAELNVNANTRISEVRGRISSFYAVTIASDATLYYNCPDVTDDIASITNNGVFELNASGTLRVVTDVFLNNGSVKVHENNYRMADDSEAVQVISAVLFDSSKGNFSFYESGTRGYSYQDGAEEVSLRLCINGSGLWMARQGIIAYVNSAWRGSSELQTVYDGSDGVGKYANNAWSSIDDVHSEHHNAQFIYVEDGDYSGEQHFSGITTIIQAGTFRGNLYGGSSDGTSVSSGNMTLNGGSFTQIYGGSKYSVSGAGTTNSLVVDFAGTFAAAFGGNRIECSGTIGAATASGRSELSFHSVAKLGQVYGGDYVKAGAGASISVFSDSTLRLLGGTRITAYAAAGALIVSGALVQTGNSELLIADGSYASVVAGGDWLQSAAVTDSATRFGNTTLAISGGTFSGYVLGGSAAKKYAQTGNTRINGNTLVSIDAADGRIAFSGNVFAGSYGNGIVDGDTTIRISGLGSNLAADGIWFSGASQGAYRNWENGNQIYHYFVTGTKTMNFSGFTGSFGGKLINFDRMVIDGNSAVEWHDSGSDLSQVNEWNIDFGSSMNWENGINDFTGDSLIIDINFEDFSIMNEPWTILRGSENIFNGWESFSTVNVGGYLAAWNRELNSYEVDISGYSYKGIIGLEGNELQFKAEYYNGTLA